MTTIFEGEYFLSHTTVVGLNRFVFCRTELSCESQSQFFSQTYNRKKSKSEEAAVEYVWGTFLLSFLHIIFL